MLMASRFIGRPRSGWIVRFSRSYNEQRKAAVFGSVRNLLKKSIAPSGPSSGLLPDSRVWRSQPRCAVGTMGGLVKWGVVVAMLASPDATERTGMVRARTIMKIRMVSLHLVLFDIWVGDSTSQAIPTTKRKIAAIDRVGGIPHIVRRPTTKEQRR